MAECYWNITPPGTEAQKRQRRQCTGSIIWHPLTWRSRTRRSPRRQSASYSGAMQPTSDHCGRCCATGICSPCRRMARRPSDATSSMPWATRCAEERKMSTTSPGLLCNTTRSGKNLSSVVTGGKAWGSLRKVYGGSVETARVATEEDEVLKDSNAKAYCVSRNRYSFNYIAFEQLAQPPSTARGLINQYLRAATSSLLDVKPCSEVHPGLRTRRKTFFHGDGIFFCSSRASKTRSVCPGCQQKCALCVPP